MRTLPHALRHLTGELAALENAGLLREPSAPRANGSISFCSNDYLGLAAACAPASPLGAGGSRLLAGNRPEHTMLEDALAEWIGADSAIVFASGYAANVGAVAALATREDLIVSDALNHASLIDGARLSRAEVVVTAHLDVESVKSALRRRRQKRAWVLTESYFSMDADSPDLRALRAACDEFDAALLVDEAHALGVFGPEGRGLCAAAEVRPDVFVGTLGKALGGAGAFVAGCRELRAWLWNRARSFVFSTGLSPAVAAGLRAALPEARNAARRERLFANVARFRRGLRALGITPLGDGPIVPIVIGDAKRARDLADGLRERGIHALAVRPPTVPSGTARLRLSVTAAHSAEQIDAALAALADYQWPSTHT